MRPDEPESTAGARPRRRLAAVGAVAAGALALVWLVVVPGEASEAEGWREAALRWGHALCWALLALAAATSALRGPRWLVQGAASAGLAVYVLFLTALIT